MAKEQTIVNIGANGMLGKDFGEQIAALPNTKVINLDLPKIDITNPKSVSTLDQIGPIDCIVNCAAYTDVDGCETNQELAFKVNGEGPANLATYCKQNKAYLVHISTDYVFDGTKNSPYLEDDTPEPLSVYGKSKLQAELRLAAIGCEHVILRTQWLYGKNGNNFVHTMLRLGQERDQLRVVNDQTGGPTFTKDLAKLLIATIEHRLHGVFHAVNSDTCTWYKFTKKIFALSGIETAVKPTTSEEFPRPAPRPRNSCLNNDKIQNALSIKIRPWDEALADFLSQRK